MYVFRKEEICLISMISIFLMKFFLLAVKVTLEISFEPFFTQRLFEILCTKLRLSKTWINYCAPFSKQQFHKTNSKKASSQNAALPSWLTFLYSRVQWIQFKYQYWQLLAIWSSISLQKTNISHPSFWNKAFCFGQWTLTWV